MFSSPNCKFGSGIEVFHRTSIWMSSTSTRSSSKMSGTRMKSEPRDSTTRRSDKPVSLPSDMAPIAQASNTQLRRDGHPQYESNQTSLQHHQQQLPKFRRPPTRRHQDRRAQRVRHQLRRVPGRHWRGSDQRPIRRSASRGAAGPAASDVASSGYDAECAAGHGG